MMLDVSYASESNEDKEGHEVAPPANWPEPIALAARVSL